MKLNVPFLLTPICFVSAARGSDYGEEEDPNIAFRTYYDEGLSPAVIIVIIAVALLIKAAIICCCCLCCPASPIYRWCHRNNSTNVTIIQPTSSYPVNVGQNNFSFGLPPQSAMVHDPPPRYNRDGYSKFSTPPGLESGYDQ